MLTTAKMLNLLFNMRKVFFSLLLPLLYVSFVFSEFVCALGRACIYAYDSFHSDSSHSFDPDGDDSKLLIQQKY